MTVKIDDGRFNWWEDFSIDESKVIGLVKNNWEPNMCCGRYFGQIKSLQNHTALLRIDEDNRTVAQFDAAPDPYNYLNFDWYYFDESEFEIQT